MQVLKNNQQRLPLTLTDHQSLYRIKSTAPPLLWIHRAESFDHLDYI